MFLHQEGEVPKQDEAREDMVEGKVQRQVEKELLGSEDRNRECSKIKQATSLPRPPVGQERVGPLSDSGPEKETSPN